MPKPKDTKKEVIEKAEELLVAAKEDKFPLHYEIKVATLEVLVEILKAQK